MGFMANLRRRGSSNGQREIATTAQGHDGIHHRGGGGKRRTGDGSGKSIHPGAAEINSFPRLPRFLNCQGAKSAEPATGCGATGFAIQNCLVRRGHSINRPNFLILGQCSVAIVTSPPFTSTASCESTCSRFWVPNSLNRFFHQRVRRGNGDSRATAAQLGFRNCLGCCDHLFTHYLLCGAAATSAHPSITMPLILPPCHTQSRKPLNPPPVPLTNHVLVSLLGAGYKRLLQINPCRRSAFDSGGGDAFNEGALGDKKEDYYREDDQNAGGHQQVPLAAA